MMKKLHRSLMLVLVIGLAVGGVVVGQSIHSEGSSASGIQGHFGLHQQGGDEGDVKEHVAQIAEQLDLTTEQRFALEDSMERAHELMREFHQLHTDLMAQLDADQQESLNAMLHQVMSDTMMSMGGMHEHECKGANCSAHGAGHGAGHGEAHTAPHGASGDLHKKGHGIH